MIQIYNRMRRNLKPIISFLVYKLFRLLPLQDKVIASTFNGIKYGDNTQYIIEAIHELDPAIDLVWVKNPEYEYRLPPYVRMVPCSKSWLSLTYEYATAKVWIDTHRLPGTIYKRKGQLFVETWHGGLAIKKLDGDVEKFRNNKYLMMEVNKTFGYADICVSNSDQLNSIYRSAFFYKGDIWKCGYPRNDILFRDNNEIRDRIFNYYGIPAYAKIMFYAPTFRDSVYSGDLDLSVYDLDYEACRKTLEERFGGDWYIIIRFHPFLLKIRKLNEVDGERVINATQYPDMQELLCACDALITDYSSCIFEAALRNIPCFTFAKDFEAYKGDRGAYFEIRELPFPCAEDNNELMENIRRFDKDEYIKRWNGFKESAGFCETGHAARDIAYVVDEFIKGNNEPLKAVKREGRL